MGLEDLAAFRAIHGSTVLYPCDAHQTGQLVARMAELDGVRYLRTSRGDTPVIYGPGEEFPVGGSKVLRSSDADRLTVVAAGVTVHEALSAAELLAEEGIPVRVIDLYSVKPVDRRTLREAAERTGCLITVEDHREEGGIGDAVMDAFTDGGPVPRLVRLAVRVMPGSASPERSSSARRASTPSRSRRRHGSWWSRASYGDGRRPTPRHFLNQAAGAGASIAPGGR
ncbi:1-deoxy-D-xylulose-5-phosphate synthase [Streptomyces alboniger]